MVIVERWTGQEAADLRAALRLPITKFAGDLGIAEGTVSKWERMLRAIEPSPLLQAVLDHVLGNAPAEVQDRFTLLSCSHREASTDGSASTDGDTVAADLNRRELLRLLSIAGPAVALTSRGEGASAQEDPEQLLDGYDDASARLWRIYSRAAPKSAVLPLVNNQLRVVTARLRAASASRRRLCALASELFQLAGEIFFDEDRYGDAAHCYTMAATAAQEAGAADLWACAITRHSFLYVYGQDFRPAVPLLEYAAQIADGGDRQLSTRQWVSVVQAQAHAGLGDLAACRRALDSAEQVRGLGPAMQNGGWLRFDGARLPEEQGACYVELRQPDLASAALQEALESQLSPRRRGSVHVDLARTGLQRHDVDEFAVHVRSALDIADQTQSLYLARRLRALRPDASAFLGSSTIRDVCDRITALVSDQPA